MSFNKSQRTMLSGVIALLTVIIVALQYYIDPLRRQPAIEPKNAGKAGSAVINGAALPFEYSLGAVTGFRQVIAGLLWVRSDAFFHEGNYDAILPLIRLITWMDPNWLDPYSTGAWHLMYNFTDTDQRSDRRYLPAGIALLKEGIANNPTTYDMYKEAGWNNFDKIHDYVAAAKYYKDAETNDPHYDLATVGHALAHCYERQGMISEAIEEWKKCVAKHKALVDDPKTSADVKGRSTPGYSTSLKNLNIDEERQRFYPKDSKPPVDAQFTLKVVRLSSKVIEVSGTMNLQGSKNWSDKTGLLLAGPVDGARVDVRLQDAGYVMPTPDEFTFEVDPELTIMQDSISIRGGKQATAGGIYISQKTENGGDPDTDAQKVGVFGFGPVSGKDLGVPLNKAIGGGTSLSALGQLQAVSIAYPIPYSAPGVDQKKQYSPEEVTTLFAKLKSDAPKLAELTGKGYCVATKSVLIPGSFKRKIDMSKDPKMYSFARAKYDFIASVNSSGVPDFVKDRIGWVGEGLTDKRFLDTKTVPGVRNLRDQVELSREDLTGSGGKVIVAP